MDGEFPIEAAAEVPGIDIAGEYGNATELMPSLAESEDVASSVARQWMRFGCRVPRGPRTPARSAAAHENGGGDLRAMIGAITQTDAFRHRRLPE
jgi:hypothetical protein